MAMEIATKLPTGLEPDEYQRLLVSQKWIKRD
jgi:hypothetical protein